MDDILATIEEAARVAAETDRLVMHASLPRMDTPRFIRWYVGMVTFACVYEHYLKGVYPDPLIESIASLALAAAGLVWKGRHRVQIAS